MWDEDDRFGRWVQLVCGVLLFGLGSMLLYFDLLDWARRIPVYHHYTWGSEIGIVCIVLGGRCLWYAVTGKGNINRDDY